MKDAINPNHYRDGGIETIDFIEAKRLDFHLGNVVKYVSRAGKKNGDELEDLKKARWYLERAIAKREQVEADASNAQREFAFGEEDPNDPVIDPPTPSTNEWIAPALSMFSSDPPTSAGHGGSR